MTLYVPQTLFVVCVSHKKRISILMFKAEALNYDGRVFKLEMGLLWKPFPGKVEELNYIGCRD